MTITERLLAGSPTGYSLPASGRLRLVAVTGPVTARTRPNPADRECRLPGSLGQAFRVATGSCCIPWTSAAGFPLQHRWLILAAGERPHVDFRRTEVGLVHGNPAFQFLGPAEDDINPGDGLVGRVLTQNHDEFSIRGYVKTAKRDCNHVRSFE